MKNLSLQISALFIFFMLASVCSVKAQDSLTVRIPFIAKMSTPEGQKMKVNFQAGKKVEILSGDKKKYMFSFKGYESTKGIHQTYFKTSEEEVNIKDFLKTKRYNKLTHEEKLLLCATRSNNLQTESLIFIGTLPILYTALPYYTSIVTPVVAVYGFQLGVRTIVNKYRYNNAVKIQAVKEIKRAR
ncbi:hypothetical protein [Flammeovirga kamogawensis]|uniref:Uncharacterized protein n=1 Tax=Flammeovirga kamogawensis TaxID=373891 RepID=A0ABX8H5W1_9BACT|nr:hypothetical protein [Flammeovirga kamogawensis]MBB6463869.1 hypothetical protein [Flammeovirga kamogawensis]QWG10791.1 hypothetical protein KM029_26660 [Flammeovirga kamogawensis]TRX63222.1 hypothetical protein EO216_26570 [Flammeovirga kamogawensis]